MKFSRAGFSFYSLTLIGSITSAYLFLRHLTLMNSSFGGGADFCSEIFALSCDDALRSPIANFFGIPLAGWGFIYYLSAAAILSLGDFLEDTFKSASEDLLVLVTGIAALLSSLFIIAFVLDVIPFCPLCLLIHIINLTIFFAVIKVSSKSIPESLISFYSGVKEFFVTKGPIPGKTKQQIIPLLLLAALGLIMYQWMFMQVVGLNREEQISIDDLNFMEEYEKEKFVKIPSFPDDPVAGPADALVNMVVFSDFECSGCRTFSERITTLLNKYRTELKVIYKHYPLSPGCNDSVRRDLHPNSCQAAYAAVAAHRQGRFWEYHDLLYSSKISGEEEQFINYARILDLDISTFTEDMNSAAKEKVAEDINLAHELGVHGTPTVYVNGRRVKNLSPDALAWLVKTMYGIIKNQTSR